MLPVPPPPPPHVVMTDDACPKANMSADQVVSLDALKAAAANVSMEVKRNQKATQAVREARSGDTPADGTPPVTRLLGQTRGYRSKAK